MLVLRKYLIATKNDPPLKVPDGSLIVSVSLPTTHDGGHMWVLEPGDIEDQFEARFPERLDNATYDGLS